MVRSRTAANASNECAGSNGVRPSDDIVCRPLGTRSLEEVQEQLRRGFWATRGHTLELTLKRRADPGPLRVGSDPNREGGRPILEYKPFGEKGPLRGIVVEQAYGVDGDDACEHQG